MDNPTTEAAAVAAPQPIRRRIYLIKKDFQFRHVLYTLSVPVIFANLGIAALPILLFYWPPDVLDIPRFDDFLSYYFRLVVSAMILEILGFVVIFWTTLRNSHRIAGPLFNLERCMERATAGDLSARTRFREGDEFPELAEAFNKMMEGLGGRQGQWARSIAEIARAAEAGPEGRAEAARLLSQMAQEMEKGCPPSEK